MAFNRGNFEEDQSEEQALLQRISEAVVASRRSGGAGPDFNPQLESSEERQRLSQSSIQKLGELGRLRQEFEQTGTSNPGDIQVREALAKDISEVMKELKNNEKARTRQENVGRRLEGKLGTIKAADDHSIIPNLDVIERDITKRANADVAREQQSSQQAGAQSLKDAGLVLRSGSIGAKGGVTRSFGQPTPTGQGQIPKGFVPKSSTLDKRGNVTTSFGPPTRAVPDAVIDALGTPDYQNKITDGLRDGTVKTSQLKALNDLDKDHQMFGFLPKKQQEAWMNFIHAEDMGIPKEVALKELEAAMLPRPSGRKQDRLRDDIDSLMQQPAYQDADVPKRERMIRQMALNAGFSILGDIIRISVENPTVWEWLGFAKVVDTDALIFEASSKLSRSGGLLNPEGQ